MPNYSHVQFIAWDVYTGPVYTGPTPEDHPLGPSNYPGFADIYPGIAFALGDRRLDILGQFLDIKARVEFTRLAIEAACQEADADAGTLKIFMAPEFLYRGAAGAYLYDLLNGWVADDPFGDNIIPEPYNKNWPGLFGELRELVKDAKFQDWIFVFGSAVGAAFQTSNGKIIMDRNHPASGWNQSLIQCGGDTEAQIRACYFTQKHLKSGIDFIEYNLTHPNTRFFTEYNIDHSTTDDLKILDGLMLEDPLPHEVGGSLFRFPHICGSDGKMLSFGLEICLDHMQASAASSTGRLAGNDAEVNIQLVPSCGMTLIESSLALAPKDGPKTYSYAFNCDGLGSHDPSGTSGFQLSGHSQLWGGSEAPKQPSRHLMEIINTLQDPPSLYPGQYSLQDLRSLPVGDSVDLSAIKVKRNAQTALGIDLAHIPAVRLWRSHAPFQDGEDSNIYSWPQGAGFVRALPVQPLCPPSDPAKDSSES